MKLKLLLVLVVLAGFACSDDSTSGRSDADAASDAGSDLSDSADLLGTEDMGSDADSGAGDMGSTPDIDFQTGVEVDTTSGRTRGESEDGLRVFKGIPYAEPPVGDRRFMAPGKALPWDGLFEADEFGDSCLQTPLSLNTRSEDCLTLNVWAHQDAKERPVMVWIYGGGFVIGESSMSVYDGGDLAVDGDVVLITINYRLGILANLALPELEAEDPNDAVGNMGLLDQVEALRWIKANAAAFGGDPDNITVFGESAGAISACALIGTPLADDLFHKVILQSGSCTMYGAIDGGTTGPNVFDFGELVVEDLGCDGAADRLACLRALPEADVADAISVDQLSGGGALEVSVPLGPTIDGVVLPKTPYERIKAGEAPARPMIVGSNGNEGKLFTSGTLVLTRASFRAELEAAYGDAALAAAIDDLYPLLTYPLAKDAFDAFVGELLLSCNQYHAARVGQGDAYYYELMNSVLVTMTPYGPLHAADLFYVFGNFVSSGIVPSILDIDLSDRIQHAWGIFAWTGAPTWEGGWPALQGTNPEYLNIGLTTGPETDFRSGRCDALQALGVLP